MWSDSPFSPTSASSLVRVTPPAIEPLTLTEAKLHLRVDPSVTDDDTLIGTLIQAAREQFESITNRALITQTWRMNRDCFPCGDTVELGMADVRSVSVFTYVAIDGTTQPVTGYTLDADHFPARLIRGYGTTWPATRTQRNAVTTTFITGIAADESEVPAQILAGLKLLIGTWYDNRVAFVESRFALEVPFSVDALFAPYQRFAAGMA